MHSRPRAARRRCQAPRCRSRRHNRERPGPDAPRDASVTIPRSRSVPRRSDITVAARAGCRSAGQPLDRLAAGWHVTPASPEPDRQRLRPGDPANVFALRPVEHLQVLPFHRPRVVRVAQRHSEHAARSVARRRRLNARRCRGPLWGTSGRLAAISALADEIPRSPTIDNAVTQLRRVVHRRDGSETTCPDGQEVFGHRVCLSRRRRSRPRSVLPTDRVVKLTCCSIDSYPRSG